MTDITQVTFRQTRPAFMRSDKANTRYKPRPPTRRRPPTEPAPEPRGRLR